MESEEECLSASSIGHVLVATVPLSDLFSLPFRYVSLNLYFVSVGMPTLRYVVHVGAILHWFSRRVTRWAPVCKISCKGAGVGGQEGHMNLYSCVALNWYKRNGSHLGAPLATRTIRFLLWR